MTNTPTTPPEVVEQWRAEFDSKYFTMSTIKLDKKTGKYRPRLGSENNAAAEKECVMMNNWLDVWIASRQAACIELPKPDDGWHSLTLDQIAESCAAQGYKCRVK